MFGTDAAVVLTSPFVEEGLDLVHHFLLVVATRYVQVHVAVPNVSVAHATYNIASQAAFHDLHA